MATSGPTGSLEELYRSAYAPQVRRAALICGSGEAANDIVQSVFEAMSKRWATIEQPEHYLSRSVLNGCRDHLRRQGSRLRLVRRLAAEPVAAMSGEPDPLDDALAALPYRQRAMVVLRFYERMSFAEIAAAIDCPTGSVGPTLDRALRALREALS